MRTFKKVTTKFCFGNLNTTAILRSESLIEQLPPLEIASCDGGIIHVPMDDIYTLFNQQRLSNLSPQLLDLFNSELSNSGPSSLNTMRSRMSDDQLLTMIKPRNIQSMSELMAWSDHLMRTDDDYKEYLKSRSKKSESDSKDTSHNSEASE